MNSQHTAQRGSVVLVALCFTIVLGLAVAGYVSVCARTMQLSNRSFCYTSSVHLAEIGMEEALWSLNQALNTSSYAWSGWTLTGSTATKTLTGFTINQGVPGTINITVSNYNTTDPFGTPSTITVDGIVQMTDGITIDKQISATVKPASLFNNAIGGAGSTVTFAYTYWSWNWYGGSWHLTSTSGSVDSYDSSQGNYSSSSNQSDQALISGTYLYLNSATIFGYATTSNSSASTPSGGSIHSLTGSSTDNNRVSNNGSQNTFDIVTPTGAGNTLFGGATTGTTTIGTAGATTPSIYYDGPNGIALTNSDILTIDGPVIIAISHGGFSISNSAKISVTANGSAQIYVAGNNSNQIYIGGYGIDNSQTKKPSKFVIFYASTSSSPGQVTLNISTTFYGAVYAPNSPLAVNTDQTIYGALAAQSVVFNCVPTIHYDLALRKTTFSLVNTPYVVSQWIKN